MNGSGITAPEQPAGDDTRRGGTPGAAAAGVGGANGGELEGDRRNHGLKKNSLGVPSIFFYIIAAASPLTVIVAVFPIILSSGNGIGMPGAFVVAAGVLMLFAVGYVAMSRHVTNAGAFYAYVTLGLGRLPGLGAAFLSIFAYTAIQAGLYGGFGYYASQFFDHRLGISIPWWAFSLIALVLCLALGLQGVHSGAKVLGVFMTLEIMMITMLSLWSLFAGDVPVSQFTLEPFKPSTVFAGAFGVALMFAHASFIGFEGSAIYGEEAKDPQRTVPRATYLSVAFMGTLYAVSGWLIVNALGLDRAIEMAKADGGDFIFDVGDDLIGHNISVLFQVLIITAMFAAIITFHNNVARYLFSIGRQGLLWEPLGWTLSSRQTPWIASIVQSVMAGVIVVTFAAFSLEPFDQLFVWATGIGATAVILSQLIAGVAIFVFFRRSNVDKRVWNTFVAPLLAIIGLAAFMYWTLRSLDVLLAVTGPAAIAMISLIFMACFLGIAYGFYLRLKSPEKYDRIGKALNERELDEPAHEAM